MLHPPALPRLLPMAAELTQARMAALHAGRPYTIELCPTQACNARCTYCYARERTDSGTMDPEGATMLLEEAWELGARELGWLGGEPLVYPQFWRVTERAARTGFAIHLRTNGLLLPKLSDEQRSLLSLIRVHIDTLDAALYEEIYGVPQRSFLAMLAETERLIATDPDRVQLVAVVTRWNVRSLYPLIDTVTHEWKRPLLLLQFREARSAAGLDAGVSDAAMEALIRYWLDAIGLAYEGRPPKLCGRSSTYCRTELYVDERFDVHPCDMVLEPSLRYTPGNLAGLWNELRPYARYAAFEQTAGRFCEPCEFASICFGCRSIALAENGDAAGIDPSCPRVRQQCGDS